MSEPIDKSWMSEPDRGNTVYSFGVEAFLKFAEWKLGGEKCRCPCKKCRNGTWFTYKEVGYHLISSGIVKHYRVWNLHGETPSNVAVHPPFVTNNIREKASSDVGIGMENPEEEIIGDVGIGMENFVDSTYDLHGDATRGDGSLGIDDEPYVPEPDLGKRYWDYKRKASEKLYPTCEGPETTLSALVELHNLKKEFGWSGNGMTVLLTLLRRWLPKGNTLPEKYPVMKAMLKDLGMKATCIHACENNCILYWKTNKDLTECPQCKAPRFKVNGGKGKKNSKEPKKEQFEFSVDGHVARPIVEALYPQKLRSVRAKYRTEYLAKASNIEEAKGNVPPAVSADLWVQFVDHEFMPEVKEKNAKYKINRSLNKVGVAVGRQTYSQIHYKKEKENPTKKRCRVDDWLTGHEHKDGTPLESAKETYEKVKEIHVKMLESGVPTDDISSDALSQVLGEDKKNRVRGVSSCSTKKQLYSSSLALASVNPSQSLGVEMAGLKADMEEVKTLLKGRRIQKMAVKEATSKDMTATSEVSTSLESRKF